MDVSEEQAAPAAAVRRGTITVMSAACGIMVGNVYLCQPLLHEIAVGFGVTEQAAGLVAVAAQIGQDPPL